MKTAKSNKGHNDLSVLKSLRQKLKAQQAITPAVPLAVPTKKESMKTLLKSSQPTALATTDKQLFLQAVKGVKPLKSSQRHFAVLKANQTQTQQHKRLQQQATGYQRLAALHGISDTYTVDYDERPNPSYLNPLCGTDVLRNLKKGRWAIMGSLDLHGSNLEQARLRLDYFLQHCLAEQYKCVRIVHGKGYGSKNQGPVLPVTVRRWLSQLDFVLAYIDCKPNEGGEGAVKVLLRTTPHFVI